MTGLERRLPALGRLGQSLSSMNTPLHPLAIRFFIVRWTLRTLPPPVSASAKTVREGAAEEICPTFLAISGIVRSPISGSPRRVALTA